MQTSPFEILFIKPYLCAQNWNIGLYNDIVAIQYQPSAMHAESSVTDEVYQRNQQT